MPPSSASPFDLTGHCALVTGGNSGIGLGMAEALAQAGADVAVWGTNESKNTAAHERLAAHGTKVVALRCDVGDEAEVEAAFAATVAELGKVDSCFANAGISGGAPSFAEFSLEQWHRVLRVNLDGAFLTLRAAVRHMVERGEGGRLAVTTSMTAIEGAPRNQAYAASKGAVVSMMKGLAVELARYDITANAVMPGWIETPMTERIMQVERFSDAMLRRIPFRRWGEPADFGGIAVYLASGASKYHTGDTITIDGGYGIF